MDRLARGDLCETRIVALALAFDSHLLVSTSGDHLYGLGRLIWI